MKRYLDMSTPQVYQVYFRADDFPAIEVALQLTPLKTGPLLSGGTVDYGVRWGLDDIVKMVSSSDTTRAAIVELQCDSVVQLYKSKPEEAMWIPMCERVFHGG